MSKFSVQRIPARHGPWHSDGINTKMRHVRGVFGFQVSNGQTLRRPTTGVESIKLAGLRVPINREQVSADTIHHRLDHAHGGVGRDSSIHGRSSRSEEHT